MKPRLALLALAGVIFWLTPYSLEASARPVGLAVAESRFSVGSSVVEGQATLFDGDAVASSYLATRVNLKDGSRFTLGIESEATVYADHLSLVAGSVDIINKTGITRVHFCPLLVSAERPGVNATIYRTDKDKISVLVRAGEVKVGGTGGRTATLGVGQLGSFKISAKGFTRIDSDRAVVGVSRIQSEQLASLIDASRSYNCLDSRAQEISRSFASVSTQLASIEASRSAVQSRITSGAATSSDLLTMASLTTKIDKLGSSSAAISSELSDAAYAVSVFHHPCASCPPAPFPSPHTVHGHVNLYPHHGQHGHTIPGGYPDGIPYGDHQVPPHHYAQPG
jgi:hypothetical protein